MNIAVECDCGQVQGLVNPKNLFGYRAACLCDDCQAYAYYLQRSDTLDINGGTDIIPSMPSHYQITAGAEKLSCVRLSDKGMYRWYAECCKTPMGNAMASASMPYIGIPERIFEKKNSTSTIEELFGPVTERMQAQFAKGELPPLSKKTVSFGFMVRVIKFILIAKMKGAGSPSPFFNSDGQPIKLPRVLSKSERDALRPLTGSKRNDI